jgi:hypothetical protein
VKIQTLCKAALHKLRGVKKKFDWSAPLVYMEAVLDAIRKGEYYNAIKQADLMLQRHPDDKVQHVIQNNADCLSFETKS